MGLIKHKTGVEHIDTNIIIRMVVRDNQEQLKKIRKLFAHKNNLYVFEDSAMMEVVYVLASNFYQYSREKIAKKIKTILEIPNLVCNKGLLEDALNLYVAHPKLSFVDCYLIATTNISGESPLWTFDRKLLTQCPIAREP